MVALRAPGIAGPPTINDQRGGPGRRDFLRLMGSAIAVATLGPACHADLSVTGVLAVYVSGLSVSQPPTDGGALVIAADAGRVNFPSVVPSDGMVTGDVPSGDYTVAYTPPSGYILAGGEDAVKAIPVTAGQTSVVTFAVVAAGAPTGTLSLVVYGLQPPVASAGSASVQRTDVTGSSPTTVNIPAAGTVDLTVVAGTYAITYTPAAPYVGLESSPNRLSIVVAPNSVTAAVFRVTDRGILRIIVEGLGAQGGGGSASVLRTDVSGQAPQSFAIPRTVNGDYLDLAVLAGVYSVTYAPPPAYTGAGTQSATVVAGGNPFTVTGIVTFAVVPSGAVRAEPMVR